MKFIICFLLFSTNAFANVGIGTTSPTAPLQVSSASANSQIIINDTAQGTGMSLNAYWPTLTFNGYQTGATTYAVGTGYVGLINMNPTNGNFEFVTGGDPGSAGSPLGSQTTVLQINQNGNVGIGATAPDRSLEVVGEIEPHDTNVGGSTDGAVRIKGNTQGTPYGTIQFVNSTGVTQYGYIAGGPGGIGIGTTSPGFPLQVNGSAYIGTSGIGVGLVAGDHTPTQIGSLTAGTSNTNAYSWLQSYNSQPLALNPLGSYVGIGITNPSYTLHVVGTAGLSTGTAWTNASDIRLKDVHGDYEYGLDEVLKLHTVRFNYKKDNPLGLPSDHPMTGFIAQEVQKVIPDAVHENKNGYLELNVDPIHWAVVNAVKELKQFIDDIYGRLSGQIADQARDIASVKADAAAKDRDIASVKAENEKLKQENAAIKAYLCGKDPSAAICQ